MVSNFMSACSHTQLYRLPAAPPRAVRTGEPQDQSPGHAVDHVLENRGRSLPLTACDRSPFPTSDLCNFFQMLPIRTLMKVSISILLRLASASISTWQIEHTYRWFTAGPPPNLSPGREGGEGRIEWICFPALDPTGTGFYTTPDTGEGGASAADWRVLLLLNTVRVTILLWDN